jgi:gas vesicle protein
MKFLFGLAIGIVVGLLYAPAPGEETRRRLAEKARELPQLPQQKAREIAASAKAKAGDLGAKLGRQAAEAAIEKATPNIASQQTEKIG